MAKAGMAMNASGIVAILAPRRPSFRHLERFETTFSTTLVALTLLRLGRRSGHVAEIAKVAK
jgi:hypothetical protein